MLFGIHHIIKEFEGMKGFLSGRNIESCIHDLIPDLRKMMGDKINPTGQ